MKKSNLGLIGAGLLAVLTLASPPVPAMESAEDCLARAIYFEARDDGPAGMEAVASVVINRVKHSEFPDEICAVVKEGGEQPPCQFSWWCDGKSDQPENAEAWAEAVEIARRWVSSPPADPTGDALYFHQAGAEAPFHEDRELVAEVGSHLFYR
ncbi:MAG: cell wall hydrolase [Solirubrobacterales bacterium]